MITKQQAIEFFGRVVRTVPVGGEQPSAGLVKP